MGSLVSPPCTVLTSNCISPLIPIYARRSRRFEVSCNGGEKPSAEGGRIDRRNMLMGLGGLYSAANLVSSDPKLAVANPIPPPDFKTCGLSHVTNNKTPPDMKDVPCCPPFSDTINPYMLPAVTSMRVRKAAHTLDPDSVAQYEEAIRLMRALDVTDPSDPRGFTQQAKIHCAYCNGAYPETGYPDVDISVHYSWLFFPFHRWYLYFYERILGSLVGDPNFALPYWNWDNPSGMQMPAIFNHKLSPLYDLKRNQLHVPPAIVNLEISSDSDTDDGQKIANNLSIMHNEMISAVSSTIDFMGQPYRAGDPVPGTAKGGTSERGSHLAVHVWVGDPNQTFNEDMGNFYSAGYDPLFYSHHANVDRMWTIWRNLGTSVPKNINDGDYLNSSFLFYDENKELRSVRVADCLDYTKLGYDYQYSDITPWVNYTPQRKARKAKIRDLSKRAEVAEKVKFPLALTKTTRILVQKTAKGKADEVLVLENVDTDPTKLIKFDVFINDEDDKFTKLDRAEYAGTFAQLPHTAHSKKSEPSSFNISLKELYDNIDIDDDDAVVVTLYPIYNGQDVTIGGIKIIKSPPKAA